MSERVILHNSAAIGENSITMIREYFMRDAEPLKEHEFKEFWQSLSEAEKDEFRRADLSK